jgi:hypothetical protein
MPIDFDRDEDPDPPVADAAPTIALPPRFILVNHHPHANKPDEIIPLDRSSSLVPLSEDDPRPAPLPDVRPWAPFKTYSDYKFTSRRVRRRAPNAEIDEDLDNHHTRAFSSDCFITSRNHREMEKSLAAARTSNTPASITPSYVLRFGIKNAPVLPQDFDNRLRGHGVWWDL